MEFGSINVVPGRSCFSKSDIENVQMKQFDFVKQTKFTPSFISYILNCYEIPDAQLLIKIIPEKFSDIYDQVDVIKEIVSFFKIYGIQIDSSPEPNDHFSTVQNSIYKNDDSCIVYSKENFLEDIQSEEDIDFNFTSKDILKYLDAISVQLRKPVIVLYYTPLGFLRISSEKLDPEVVNNSYFFIVLGQDVCITLEFAQFCIQNPQKSYGNRKAGYTFFPIINFEVINGRFHPNFNDTAFSHFTRNCTSFPTRNDFLSFPYDLICGQSKILIGLIGVYSTISNYLSHEDVKVTVIDFNEPFPFIGIYISKAAFVYVFLYIPDNLPPNHPLYLDVTTYATSFMQRICAQTFFLSEDDDKNPSFSVKSNFHIGGLTKLYNNRILGGFDTSLILHCEQASSVGNLGEDFVQFKSIDEFHQWKKFISRRYQITPASSEKADSGHLSFNQVINLVSDYSYEANKKQINDIINGVRDNSKDDEIDSLVQQCYNEYLANKTEENKSSLSLICNKKIDQFTLFFNQASHWMKSSSFVLNNQCEFCNLSCDEKPDQDSSLWSNACFRCKLLKLQKFNKETRGSKIPTQFLEEKVDEIVENEKNCKELQEVFREYLLNNDRNGQEFTKWFFEYWTILALNSNIDKIKTTGDIIINEEVKKQYNKEDEDFSLLNFINKLTESQLEGIEYYSILPFVFLQVPIEVDSDVIRNSYLNYYIENILPILFALPEISPFMFYERCKKKFDILATSGFVNDSIVEVSNVRSAIGNMINVDLKWKEKNSESNGKSSNYIFYSISDTSLLNSSFTSKPMNCTEVVLINSQPISFFIVNSFYLSKYNKTIIVSVLGHSLWINVLNDGFNSSFLPDPVFSLEVEKDSGKSSFCSFASLANLMILFVKEKSGEFKFYSVQISRDFKSSTVIAHRSFNQIAPLSSKYLFSSKFYGFNISSDASVAIFCADYNNDSSENNNNEFALIKFDPWTLIAKEREDSFEVPFNPIFIDSSSQYSYDIICQCENNSSMIPSKSNLFMIPLDGKRTDEVLGVVLWRGEPRLVKLNENNEPVFELPDSFKIETQLSFTPSDAVHVVSDAINKFGVSEIDRISNGHYPIDSVSVESIFDIQKNKELLDKFFESGKEYASNGIELHLFAHQNPSSFNSKCSLINNVTIPEKNDPKRSFFPFFHRITAAPRFLIKSPIQPTVYYSNSYTSSVLEESFISRKSSFPPLPLIRELINKGDVECKTFSVVNGSSSSSLNSSFESSNLLNERNFGFCSGLSSCSDGKDTEILSAYSGIQFINSPPASVRIASTIVPIEFNKLKKINKFYLLNSLSFSPLDPNSATHCALALLHAISCSGAVTFVTRKDVQFVAKVFQMMRDSIPAIENSAQHMDFNFNKSADSNDDSDDEIALNFEPANFIIIVCNLGYQHEREAAKLKNEIASLINGLEPGNICYDILSKEILVLPIDLDSQEIAKIISDSTVLPSLPLEASTSRVLDFVASYGSFIDNTYLFKFDA